MITKYERVMCPVCRANPQLVPICTVCHGEAEVVFVHVDGLIEIHPVSDEAEIKKQLPSRRPYHMTTFTGKQFTWEDPQTNMIEIEDIAHALSMICHWGGHMSRFFSVAQHSVLVSRLCPPELAQWGLLHDAAEAYCGDVVRGLKQLLPDYKVIEHRVLHAITRRFGLSPEEPAALKEFDNQALQLEADRYMPHDIRLFTPSGDDIIYERRHDIPAYWLNPMEPRTAEIAFLARYRKLFLDDDGL